MPLVLNGTTGVQDNSGAFVRATAVASTSGTSIDFTSIPSWVKRVTVVFNEVSTNGSSLYNIRLGTSGGVVASGYVATGTGVGSGVGTTSSTSGFIFGDGISSGNTVSGIFVITNIESNNWIFSGTAKRSTGDQSIGNGSISLAGTLDRVRITTANGTDTFDLGSINILYE
jgi:hypothetical protein